MVDQEHNTLRESIAALMQALADFMRPLLSFAAKAVATAFGGWLGFVAGFGIAYYAGDHGDVGSALLIYITAPVTILVWSIGAYYVATIALRRFDTATRRHWQS